MFNFLNPGLWAIKDENRKFVDSLEGLAPAELSSLLAELNEQSRIKRDLEELQGVLPHRQLMLQAHLGRALTEIELKDLRLELRLLGCQELQDSSLRPAIVTQEQALAIAKRQKTALLALRNSINMDHFLVEQIWPVLSETFLSKKRLSYLSSIVRHSPFKINLPYDADAATFTTDFESVAALAWPSPEAFFARVELRFDKICQEQFFIIPDKKPSDVEVQRSNSASLSMLSFLPINLAGLEGNYIFVSSPVPASLGKLCFINQEKQPILIPMRLSQQQRFLAYITQLQVAARIRSAVVDPLFMRKEDVDVAIVSNTGGPGPDGASLDPYVFPARFFLYCEGLAWQYAFYDDRDGGEIRSGAIPAGLISGDSLTSVDYRKIVEFAYSIYPLTEAEKEAYRDFYARVVATKAPVVVPAPVIDDALLFVPFGRQDAQKLAPLPSLGAAEQQSKVLDAATLAGWADELDL